MKEKLLIGAVVAGGVALTLRSLAPHVRKMHEQCREMMAAHGSEMTAGALDSMAARCGCRPSRETAVAH